MPADLFMKQQESFDSGKLSSVCFPLNRRMFLHGMFASDCFWKSIARKGRFCASHTNNQDKSSGARSKPASATASRFQGNSVRESGVEAFRGLSTFGAPCRHCRSTNAGRSLHHQGQGASWCEVDAAKAPRGPDEYGHFRYLLHWAGRSVRCRETGGVSARFRDSTPRRYVSLPLGQVGTIHHAGNSDWAAWP